ncbi:conserved hypothetical protein [Xylanimonas cellulosilytica DSM 15894]|uniref:ATP synthase protein I n=1 Tax=Xylanimonas cellulosilytica (strain DSM 15894 / JCM 12276 / CECT 5975 / KCTC 9989 / LMG 20990 / NBRC 107835 / XIL07) TaxID=446471 RepID=D1BWC5_XYLCX|nr:hypothetical protein [Xylanimonas cellulosilytica]ACZ31470.1 conserved hypothetical protein [Xylanimonas cellulosilytica DSM 15894]
MTDASTPDPAATPAPGRDPDAPERAMLRTALRSSALLLGGLAVVGIAVGAPVAGTAGVWGAVIGVLLAGFFCATTIWSMLRTVGSSPTAMAGVIMGAWVVKMIVLIAVLAVLRGRDFFDPYVLFGVVAVGAIGSALLDYRAVGRGRVPYVQP